MFLSLQQSDINLDIGLGNIPIDQITKNNRWIWIDLRIEV